MAVLGASPLERSDIDGNPQRLRSSRRSYYDTAESLRHHSTGKAGKWPEAVPLLQPFVYRFLQLIGLYPRSFHTSNSSTKLTPGYEIQPGLALLSVGVVALATFTYMIFLMGDWETRKLQMANLEFFSLIDFVFVLSNYTQSPLMLVLVVRNSHKFVPLIQAVEELLNKVLSGHQIKQLRLVVYASFAWHAFSLIATTLSLFQYTSVWMEKTEPHTNWTSVISFPLPDWGVWVPIYVTLIWSTICTILLWNCQWAQFLLVILVFALARACDCIETDLENLNFLGYSSSGYQMAVLRGSRINFRKVKSLINQINDFFSVIVLVSSLRDLLTCIAFINTLLRRLDREDGESAEAFVERRNDAHAILVFTYVQTGLILATASCRLFVLIYCYGQESAIRKQLQCIQADTLDQKVDKECTTFLDELGGTDTAINGGGFFFITKEFLATMIGLLLTFLILIYQTRDSKGDMIQLMKSKDLKTSINRLALELDNSTALLFKKCNRSEQLA